MTLAVRARAEIEAPMAAVRREVARFRRAARGTAADRRVHVAQADHLPYYARGIRTLFIASKPSEEA